VINVGDDEHNGYDDGGNCDGDGYDNDGGDTLKVSFFGKVPQLLHSLLFNPSLY
jgi:hypothetical protein